MIESLFRDRTVSWVRIVNGINKYVTETSQEILVTSVEIRGGGKLVAKAKPRPELTLTLSLVSNLSWPNTRIDVEPRKFSQGCFEVSIFMIRLLRHDDTVHREDDGAVRFDDLAVRNLQRQTKWILGSNGRRNDVKFLWIWSSNISCLQCQWKRRITEQRRWKEVNTLQW